MPKWNARSLISYLERGLRGCVRAVPIWTTASSFSGVSTTPRRGMPQHADFKSSEVKFADKVRSCEDAILVESLGLAILACDPGREVRNTVMVRTLGGRPWMSAKCIASDRKIGNIHPPYRTPTPSFMSTGTQRMHYQMPSPSNGSKYCTSTRSCAHWDWTLMRDPRLSLLPTTGARDVASKCFIWTLTHSPHLMSAR